MGVSGAVSAIYRITLYPVRAPDGARLMPDRFIAVRRGRQLCISKQPLLDCARILMREGALPDDTIAIRHDGDAYDAMTARIDIAARTTVRETETHGPRFVRWEAFPSRRGQPPVRLNQEPVFGEPGKK